MRTQYGILWIFLVSLAVAHAAIAQEAAHVWYSITSRHFPGGGGGVLHGAGLNFEPLGSSLNCVLV
jgi:hypothetical protein